MGALSLLWDRRFGPLFWSQCTVAFNDNLLKSGIVLLATFATTLFERPVRVFGLDADALNPLAAGLLIVPFVLFSAAAGQLADRHSRRSIIVATKALELGLMVVAGAGFVAAGLGWPEIALTVLVVLLLATGAQSTFYSPAKFSIVPMLVDESKLVAANAMLQMGSYLSILGGVIVAGLLVQQGGGPFWMGAVIVVVSALGWAASRALPQTAAANPAQPVQWFSPAPVLQGIRRLEANPVLARTVTGISWFWAVGACLLTLFPTWARDALGGGADMATYFMVLFSVGIGLGSVVCNRLSPHGLELGLVAIGALGLTVFPMVLWAIGTPYGDMPPAQGVLAFMQTGIGWAISAVIVAIATCGGIFTVPLYTLLQSRAREDERGQVLAMQNLMSSLWILLSQVALMALALAPGLLAGAMGLPEGATAATHPVLDWVTFSEARIFALIGLINLAGFLYLYWLIPEFLYRFLAWLISHLVYRLQVSGIENIPREGGCVLVCNHVTFVDWLMLGGACPRPARFVMDKFMFQLPVVNRLVKQCKAIPIASRKVDPEMLERAYDRIAEELEAGNVVCIFPEGALTRDGEPQEYRPGIERIVARTPVPVIPMALNGMWGSFFSRVEGKGMAKPFRRGLRSPIWLTVTPPLAPETLTIQQVEERIVSTWRQRPER